MSFYEELTTATAADRQYLLSAPAISNSLRGEIGLSSYLAFLGQAYHHVRHTTPLLMTLGGRLPERLAWLRGPVAEYIEEEIGHEEWILNDIAAAGGDAEAVRQSRPELPAELMVAYAYDLVNRGNPAAFFGMVFVLEGTSVALALLAADRIQEALKLPGTAFSYLRSHGTLDQEHTRHLAELVEKMTPEDQADVVRAAKVFFKLYGDIFRALPIDAVDADDARVASTTTAAEATCS
jgi:heme oxygenase